MTPQRDRGEGGIHWDAARRRWVASITVGYDGRGRRKVRRAYTRTKTEAKTRLRELRHEQQTGVLADSHAYTVRDAIEDWLERGLTQQGPATIEKYRVLCDKHILPALGARKLRDLRTREVETWLAGLSTRLGTDALRRTHACLNRAVRRAMARDWVSRNVVDVADIPRGRAGRPSKSLTPEQVDAVLSSTKKHRMHNYIVLSLLTGARTEELRALTWDHVHLGDRDAESDVPAYIEVWRSVRASGDTKTRRSRRTLALPARCVEALHHQRQQLQANRDRAGERWREHGLVFPSSIGTPMSATNARRDFRDALELVPGINPKEWTPRELRHSFVSVLSDAGVPLEEISRLVGHSGTTVTELVYRHQLRPVIQTGATVMDRLFGDAETDPNVTQLVTQVNDEEEGGG